MSTPADSELSGPAATPPVDSLETSTPVIDPNNPPWGFIQAFLIWLASVALLFIVPQLLALPYVATQFDGGAGPTQEMLLKDKTFILLIVIGFLPAHFLALILSWAVASRLGKISAIKSLGLSWPRNFGVWKSAGLAVLMFLVAMAILYKFGGAETDLERILRSSRAAALIIAFVATVTAPLVEEVIYRGLLYSALQRLTGPVLGVIIVTAMFAGLHVFQYWPNAGAITAISLLSLVLTAVRARTGRLLPCYVIHLVFNGIQSVIIVIDPYLRSLFQSWQQKAAPGILYSLFNSF